MLTFVLSMFSWRMLGDRGDQLKYAIASALSGAARVVRGLRATLTVSQREDVAEAAVNELRTLPDDPWKLSEPLPKSWGVMSDLGASICEKAHLTNDGLEWRTFPLLGAPPVIRRCCRRKIHKSESQVPWTWRPGTLPVPSVSCWQLTERMPIFPIRLPEVAHSARRGS
jgi:hypothetical protein